MHQNHGFLQKKPLHKGKSDGERRAILQVTGCPTMKILTDAQANEIIRLLLDIEKASVREQAFVDAEKIRAIVLQAEQVTIKFEQ